MSLALGPVSFREVCAFVAAHHRHHKPPQGMKFCIGVFQARTLVGVATVSRPVARAFDPRTVAEVGRTCTDGARNANSMLYGACWRAAAAMGYRRLLTYTEEGESGASLRAAGWVVTAILPARGNWAASTADPRLKEMRDPEGPGGVTRYRWEIGPDAAPALKKPVDNSEHLAENPAMPRKKAAPGAKATLPTSPDALPLALQLAHALEPVEGSETLSARHKRVSALILALETAKEPVPDELYDRLPSLEECLAAFPEIQKAAATLENERKALSDLILAQYTALGVQQFANADGKFMIRTRGVSAGGYDAEALVAAGVTPEQLQAGWQEGKEYFYLRVASKPKEA